MGTPDTSDVLDRDVVGIAETWLAEFAAALAAVELEGLGALLTPGVYWRDMLALTWDIRTFSGRDEVCAGIAEFVRERCPIDFEPDPTTVQCIKRGEAEPSVEALFDFQTDVGWCRGHVRLRSAGGDAARWTAWTVFTALRDLKGHEEKAGRHRPTFHGSTQERSKKWMTSAEHSAYFETNDPDTVVIGGAQTGLALAARLGALDIPTLVIEREPRIGDVWRNRYQSLVLHNQVWANHLPYLPFPMSWPVYIAKDQLAEWLEIYASALSLATWTSTTLEDSHYDPEEKRWRLTLRRGDGTTSIVRPRNVVLATGVFGSARRIHLPGAETFSGRIMLASDYRGGLDVAGKRALVVGSGASAHDVAQELNAEGAGVTMLQRGSTCIISLDPGTTLAYSAYREDGLPTETVDLLSDSIPHAVLVEFHKEMTRKVIDLDRDLVAGLNRAGFATNNGEEESGFLTNFHRRGGGYYINVGTSDLIVSGAIKVKHGVEIAGFDGPSVKFTEGTAADYDLVVIAAGYENMQESVRAIMGEAVAAKVGPVWGMDDHGELRAMWKRTGQDGFWIAGGSLKQNRSFSKFLALQIKARALGLIA